MNLKTNIKIIKFKAWKLDKSNIKKSKSIVLYERQPLFLCLNF